MPLPPPGRARAAVNRFDRPAAQNAFKGQYIPGAGRPFAGVFNGLAETALVHSPLSQLYRNIRAEVPRMVSLIVFNRLPSQT
jgi:hypothetical protein